MQGNEAQDLVARATELGGERGCDVTQSAGLGVGGVLGADEADAHGSLGDAPLSSRGAGAPGRARKGERPLLFVAFGRERAEDRLLHLR